MDWQQYQEWHLYVDYEPFEKQIWEIIDRLKKGDECFINAEQIRGNIKRLKLSWSDSSNVIIKSDLDAGSYFDSQYSDKSGADMLGSLFLYANKHNKALEISYKSAVIQEG